jgi:3-oxoacyl-[acyl-carrier-protein] synthase-3
MKFSFERGRVSGLLAVFPSKEQLFVDDMRRFGFPEARSMKLKEVMGYDRHRVVDEEVCSSDLVLCGVRYLFERGYLRPEEIQALIVVTQTPDYLMPPTSFIVHGELGLSEDVYCLDITQGCAGYIVGLIQALLLAQGGTNKKIVLVNVDVISRKVSPEDRNSYPLIGDAATITVIETGEQGPISAIAKFDGRRRAALTIPAGGMRIPSSPETSLMRDEGDGNKRSLDHLRMDGTAVFNFVQRDVPPLIEETLLHAGTKKENVHRFLFHQPNKFMLSKLAERLGIGDARVPMDLVSTHGNSSGATIPAVMATQVAPDLLSSLHTYCLAGFGVGLTWAAMVIPLGELDFCESIDV